MMQLRRLKSGWEGEHMTFIFKKPKSGKKIRSRDGQEILKRLNDYLDGSCEKPVKFLVSFWQDQETSFSYKEMRQAILDGSLSEEMVRLWQQDYTKMVADKMYPVWMDAIKAGASGQPIFDGLPSGFSLNTGVPNVVSWISSRGAAFVTSVTEEQRKAINALLVKRVTDKYNVDELARVIRPCIGLTEGQAKANEKYYNSIKEKLAEEHPRMKKESIEEKARTAQLKYAERQHRQRAYTIAHTEMAFAFNKGMDETVRQAQAEGLMGVVEKKWCTANVDACTICKDLEAAGQIGMDEEFSFPGKILFPGHKLTPPAHPRCRCAVQYIEVEPPAFEDSYKPVDIEVEPPAFSGTDTSSLTAYDMVGSLSSGSVGGEENPKHDEPKYLGSLDNVSYDMVKSTLKKYEPKIAEYDNESAIVVTAAGLVFQCFGTKNKVFPDADLGEELIGASVTHNHPVGSGNEYSFSDKDIQLFLDNDLEILRGVDERYIYELTTDPSNIDENVFLGEITEYDARHEQVIEKARLLGIGYRRWER